MFGYYFSSTLSRNSKESLRMFVVCFLFIKCQHWDQQTQSYGQCSNHQYGKMGPAPGRFELKNDILKWNKQRLWDLRPSTWNLQIEIMRSDRIRSLACSWQLPDGVRTNGVVAEVQQFPNELSRQNVGNMWQNLATCRDLRPFCENPDCPDPVWKPVTLARAPGGRRPAGTARSVPPRETRGSLRGARWRCGWYGMVQHDTIGWDGMCRIGWDGI